MDFKLMSIEDREIVEPYFKRLGRWHCNASFAAIVCCVGRFRPEWCIRDGFFLMRYLADDNEVEFYQPIGDGDATSMIPFMESYAAGFGKPLVISGVTKAFMERMRDAYPKWGFASDRRFADYIYRADDLRNLEGKKYQNKRNLVNKFKSLYNYRYETLRPEIFEDCISLEYRWMEQKRAAGESIGAIRLEKDMSDELAFIKASFENFDSLDIRGGAIYVDDRIVAFSYGAPVNESLFCTHIEKADVAYAGAFSMMNRQLALHLPRQYEYIDRESDDGVAGLRKAKLQYHPAFLSEEIAGRILSERELQIRELWLMCFPDDDIDDADAFILNRMPASLMFSREEDGHIVSTVFVIPFGDTAYIYACMTAPEYRGRGFFGALFDEAIAECRNNHFNRIALIPADESIGGWYERRGFRGRFHIKFDISDGYDFGTGDVEKDYGLILQLDGKECPSAGELVLSEG